MEKHIKENIYGEIVCVIYLVLFFLLAIPLYKINPEYSRKEIHIMLGNFYFLALSYFTDWYFATLGPFIFILVNFFSVKYNLIKLIIRHKKKENEKKDYGTVYAISLTFLTAYSWKIWNPSLGLCPFLIMAYGDGLACLFGKAIKSPYIFINGNKKSIAGSLTMFFISFLILYIYFNYLSVSDKIIKCLFISLCSTLLEAFSLSGTDNLTVPCISMFLVQIWIKKRINDIFIKL